VKTKRRWWGNPRRQKGKKTAKCIKHHSVTQKKRNLGGTGSAAGPGTGVDGEKTDGPHQEKTSQNGCLAVLKKSSGQKSVAKLNKKGS